jgi:protein SCO1/2
MMIPFLAILLLLLPATAYPAPDPSNFAYRQNQGTQFPLDTRFTEADGRSVRLGDVLGTRPAILALGYFHCPNLCGVVRSDLMNALVKSELRDYTLIVMSIDPREKPQDARDAMTQEKARYHPPDAAGGWHYLTGAKDQIARVEDAVGFKAEYDDALQQFIHPAGLVFLTPRGRVSGYLLGVGYKPGDLQAGVTRARSGGLEKAVLPVLLLCFHYNKTTGRYSLAVMRLVSIGAGLTVLVVGGMIGLSLRQERRR